MMNIRVENWNGFEIRFVEKHLGEWWAVAVDVCKALGLNQVTKALANLPTPGVTDTTIGVVTGQKQDGTPALQNVNVKIINENNTYRLAFKSRKKEAEEFQDWVVDMLKTLRQVAGLEGFEIFRMLDKEHQKEAMDRIKAGFVTPTKVDYIKANTIANKAVSTLNGHTKMLKKEHMTPEMLIQRQQILDDTVNLMEMNKKFNLGLSVSKTVYEKYQ